MRYFQSNPNAVKRAARIKAPRQGGEGQRMTGAYPSRSTEPPSIRHSVTSVAAAEAIKPSAAKLRIQVLEAIKRAPDGLTDEEAQRLTGIPGSTQRPRRIELEAAGLIRNSGRTRSTMSGRAAVIWICP